MQPGVDRRADDHARGRYGEQRRKSSLRHPIPLHEQERRNVDVSKESREQEAAEQRKAHAGGIGQRPPIPRQNRRGLQIAAVLNRMRFLEQDEGDERDEDGDAGQHGEDEAPGAEEQNCRAKRRRDQRRDAEHERDRGKLEARLPALEQVADDRPRQDADRSGARPLHQAKGEQHADRGRERRARDAQREQDEARAHDRLAAEPVGKRADRDRRAREAGDEDRNRRRRFRLRRVEIGLDQRQARQRHVDRQRRQGGEQTEKEREPEPVDIEAGHQGGAAPGRVTRNFLAARERARRELTAGFAHARGRVFSCAVAAAPVGAPDSRASSRMRMASDRPMPASEPAVASKPAQNAPPMMELMTGTIGMKKPIATQARQVRMRKTALAMTLAAPRLAAAVRKLAYQRSAKAAIVAAIRMNGLLVSP